MAPLMLQQLSKNKYKNLGSKKKGRRLILLLFILTTLTSLFFWIKSGKLSFKSLSLNLVLPSWSSKTYVFEKDIEPPKKEVVEPPSFEFLKEKKGIYGFWFKNLETGETLAVNENQVFQAASVNKVPVMITFYQEVEAGVLKEDQVYQLKAGDKQEGTGSMQDKAPGTKYSYKELVRLCGIESDNTALNVLLKIINYQSIKKLLKDNELEKTSLPDSLTTPFEAGRLFELLFKGKLLKEKNQEKLFGFLTNTFWEERIPAGVPKEIKVAHKIGTQKGVYSDCGIIFGETPYVLCILGNKIVMSEAEEVLPEISRLIWGFVN